MEASAADSVGTRSRAWRKLRQQGPRALLRHVRSLLSRWIHLRESHVWYRLDIASGRRGLQLPEGVQTSRATAAEVERVAELGQDIQAARQYHAAGNDLWLTLEGEVLLFACWIFTGQTPVLAAPGGWLQLPPRTVCLEDSLTSPLARGRGIAPASWSTIAEELAADGIDSMLTKVATDNQPSRRAVEKAGFETVGVMRLLLLAGHKRTTLEVVDRATAQALADGLHARIS